MTERRDFLLLASVMLFVLTAMLMCGCRSTKSVASRDSVRVEIRHHTIFVPDTIKVPLPPQKEYIVTPDSSSHLENDYAESDAAIKDGMLHHSLRTKPHDIPVVIQKEIQNNDSIIYRDREVEIEKVVYKTYWWQKCLNYISAFAFVLVFIFIVSRLHHSRRH